MQTEMLIGLLVMVDGMAGIDRSDGVNYVLLTESYLADLATLTLARPKIPKNLRMPESLEFGSLDEAHGTTVTALARRVMYHRRYFLGDCDYMTAPLDTWVLVV